MRFKIEVKKMDQGWEVQVIATTTNKLVANPATTAPLQEEPRLLRRLGDGTQAFPQPPAAEAQVIPETELHFDLCTTTDPAVLRTAYRQLLNREVSGSNNRVERFGRYLFATLLGNDLWKKLDSLAKSEPLELALSWQHDDQEINRLPWEMMHGPERFLAEEPQVAITRRVAGTTQTLNEIAPPRVLFVVGSDLTNDVIRPGAEYLGLLRSLRPRTGLRMKSHLLLKASPQHLNAAIESFRPTVVHFICHGERNPAGKCYLRLQNDENQDNGQVFAANMIQVLRSSSNTLPQIVVLSACYTATVDGETKQVAGGDVDSPLAVELANGGVPVVVGMAGKVADQACRLFTQRFYEALLEGGEIVQAAADGRRAGIIANGGTDPKASVDWALPTIFLSEKVEEARLIIKERDLEQDWHTVADHYATPGYPVFCDRLEPFQMYDLLMAQTGEKIVMRRRQGDLQVLAVSVSQADSSEGGPRYGRTWLLHELAAQAVLDGHVPVLVNKNVMAGKDWPKALPPLIEAIKWACVTTKQHFNQAIEESAQRYEQTGFATRQDAKLKWTPKNLEMLSRISSGKASSDDLHADVQEAYQVAQSPDDPRVVAKALRLDLLRLLEEVRTLRPAEEKQRTKLLLLIDDVHRMDAAADVLLNHLLDTYGLRGARKDIRVVFTYASVPAVGQETAVNTYIKNWLDRSPWAEAITLQKFQAPLEERMAYEQFLLRWQNQSKPKPLAVMPLADPNFVQSFFDALSDEVAGIPSNLHLSAPVIRTWLYRVPIKVLREANDEDQLKIIQQLKRGQ